MTSSGRHTAGAEIVRITQRSLATGKKNVLGSERNYGEETTHVGREKQDLETEEIGVTESLTFFVAENLGREVVVVVYGSGIAEIRNHHQRTYHGYRRCGKENSDAISCWMIA